MSGVPKTVPTLLPTDRAALIASVAAGNAYHYFLFWGHRKPADGVTGKSCFSQWWEASFQVDGETFRTAEHYMMVRKARLFGDEESARSILQAPSPDRAKSLGRKVRGFSEERWLQQREEIVFSGNLAKFGQLPRLRTFLLSTGDEVLVEASPVDAIWGIGHAKDDPAALVPVQWRGLNLLGFALMKVRAALRGEAASANQKP